MCARNNLIFLGNLFFKNTFFKNEKVYFEDPPEGLDLIALERQIIDHFKPPVVEIPNVYYDYLEKVKEVASWMAYEEFPKPTGAMLFDFGNDPKVIMDFTMVLNTLNFAFTDFNSGVKFEVDYQGLRRSDSEAMVACMHKAYTAGIPFFDGSFLANVTRSQLEDIFRGNIEMPMLDERVSILNEVGAVLESKYQGSYSNFIKSCSPRLYDGGSGVLERLTSEFPRFNDVSDFHGRRVEIFKLAQLGIWSLHLTLAPRKAWQLEDANMVTAFADYIVPVGLRVMKVFEYTPELESQINGLQEVKRDSDAEIEAKLSANNLGGSLHDG